jgi:hypothetical protein
MLVLSRRSRPMHDTKTSYHALHPSFRDCAPDAEVRVHLPVQRPRLTAGQWAALHPCKDRDERQEQESLELARRHVLQQWARAKDPRYRQMLQDANVAIEERLQNLASVEEEPHTYTWREERLPEGANAAFAEFGQPRR